MRLMICLFVALFSTIAMGHGEDRFGPHGGFVRMPGAFHTEVVKRGANVWVYLLDVSWKNPVTQNSSVAASLQRGGIDTPLSCKVDGNKFVCALLKGEQLKSGQLVIKATREGISGALSIYPLPLKLIKPADAHAGHH